MQEWSDEELVIVSAVEHYSYCPRQCALIHVERVYDENVYTLRGSLAHNRTDEPAGYFEQGIRVERALPIWSDRYGLIGRADVVEFHPDGTIVPVEYKITPKHRMKHAVFQLCAQAICLEEMLGHEVLRGALYSSSSHQRKEVVFTEELRRKTIEITERIREMLRRQELPPPVNDARCPNCSLIHLCMPSEIDSLRRARCEELLFSASDKEVLE